MKIKPYFYTFIILSIALLPSSLKAGTTINNQLKVTAALATLIYWFNPDRSFPTLDQLNVVTFMPVENSNNDPVAESKKDVLAALKKQQGFIRINNRLYRIHSGIPDGIDQQQEPVFLYEGGACTEPAFLFKSGSSSNYTSYAAYRLMKIGAMAGPCIVFDCPDTRRIFNFCQEQDLHCLNIVYDSLISKHPNGQVIFYGACKGATNKLRFLAEKAEKAHIPGNIKAVIVESPAISPQHALKDIKYGGRLSHALCRLALPNYSPNLKTIMDARAFPHNIPILLGSLPHDALSALPDMVAMKKHLESKGGHVEHIICKDDANIRHGRIRLSPQWQKAVRQFLLDLKLEAFR